MLKVRNMEGNSGREVANQFIIENNGNVYFQSYKSVCAKYNRKAKKLTVGRDWDYCTVELSAIAVHWPTHLCIGCRQPRHDQDF